MENRTGKLRAVKGALITYFSPTIWKQMGKNKNGWTLQEEGAATTAGTPADVVNMADYRKLYDQAKGLAKDGHDEQALAKYLEAQTIKDSPAIKGVIRKLSEKVQISKQFGQLVADAGQAVTDEEYETAIELYGSALEIKEDEAVRAAMADAQAKLKEEDITG